MTAFDVGNHGRSQAPKFEGGHRVVNSPVGAIKSAVHFPLAGVLVKAPVGLLQRAPQDLEILLKEFRGNLLTARRRR
jgi:hypothetical protein